MTNLRDLMFEPDDVVLTYFRSLADEKLQSALISLWDMDRRKSGRMGDRLHELVCMAADERDARRRANESMLDAVFPTIDLGQVTEDGSAVDSAGDQGGLPK